MLTVILFPESEREYVLKFQFIFVNFQMDKQIALCEWKEGMEPKDIFGELDSLTSESHEWKLLIFSGRMPDPMTPNTYFIEPIEILLSVYTGAQSGRAHHSVRGFLPAAIWCIGYREKRLRQRRDAASFEQVDADRRFGSGFRLIWFELDTSSNMQHRFDQFRMACGLLVLAINDIPTYFLECGYCYQLNVGIARRDFAEYIARLRGQLDQIKRLSQEAYQNLENDYRSQSRYPNTILRKSSFTDKRAHLDGGAKWKKLDQIDLLHGFKLEAVLDENRRWIRSQLYFPKGILKQELANVQNGIDTAEHMEYRLNDAAKDQLERDLLFVLDSMQGQQKKRLSKKQIMRDLRAVEKQLTHARARCQWGDEKWPVRLSLGFAETLLFAPFIFFDPIASFVSGLPLLVLLSRPAALAVAAALLCIVCCGGCSLAFSIFARREFWSSKRRYEEILREDIEGAQKERLQYMEKTVDLVAQYQYAIHLKKEDQDRLERLEQRSRTLMRHTYIRENGESICRQLEVLLGEDERVPPPELPCPCMDFTEDPNEIEYYWVPYRHSKSMAELNKSGHLINVFFHFISDITLKKTPSEFLGCQAPTESCEQGQST